MFEYFSRRAYIIIIAILIGVVLMSQQTFLSRYGRELYHSLRNNSGEYWQNMKAWVSFGAYFKTGGEEAKGGVPQTGQAKTEENKNVFSGKVFEN